MKRPIRKVPWTRSSAVLSVISVLSFTFLGMLLLLFITFSIPLEAWGDVDSVAVLNVRRGLQTGSIMLIALGVASTGRTWPARIGLGICSFLGIMTPFWIIGGAYGFFDASMDSTSAWSPDTIWVLFDAGEGLLGIDFVMISGAIKELIAPVVLVILTIQIIYSALSGGLIAAVIEAGVVTLLFIGWAMYVLPAF